MNKKDIHLEDVISQIKSEYTLGKNFVDSKRQLIRERLAKYRNITGQDKKIYNRIIRSIVKTWLAIHYNDTKNISFSGRSWNPWANAKAKLIDNLAKFDFEEMRGPEKEYRYLEDIALKWVGIKIWGIRDDNISCPDYKVIDPLCWIPDPYNDINTWPRFHGFEFEIGKSELMNSWFFEIDKVKSKSEEALEKWIEDNVDPGSTHEDIENNDYVREQRRLIEQEKNITGNEVYSIYMHYTQVAGKKYVFILANNKTLMLSQREIKSVRKEEKDAPHKVPFPVVATNLSPIQDDPFGESFFDILEDKQIALQTLENLNLIKARQSAFGDTIFFDPRSVSDPKALTQKTTSTKFVKADLSKGTPAVSLQKPQMSQEAYNMPQLLKQQAMMESNIDEGAMWVSPVAGRTATENIRIQKNSNMRMMLDRKMLMIGEKKFWDILRYRVYQENFKKWKKKQIMINSGLGSVPQVIAPDDFNALGDVAIKVESEFERQEREEKMRLMFMANAEFLINSASSEFSKLYNARKLARMSGMTDEEALISFPETYDEMNAKLDLELLNRDEKPAAIEPWQDHATYLLIYQQAHNTKAKAKAIAARRLAMIEEKRLQISQQQQAQPTAKNQNRAMINSMMQQSQQEKTPSLQDTQADG